MHSHLHLYLWITILQVHTSLGPAFHDPKLDNLTPLALPSSSLSCTSQLWSASHQKSMPKTVNIHICIFTYELHYDQFTLHLAQPSMSPSFNNWHPLHKKVRGWIVHVPRLTFTSKEWNLSAWIAFCSYSPWPISTAATFHEPCTLEQLAPRALIPANLFFSILLQPARTNPRPAKTSNIHMWISTQKLQVYFPTAPHSLPWALQASLCGTPGLSLLPNVLLILQPPHSTSIWTQETHDQFYPYHSHQNWNYPWFALLLALGPIITPVILNICQHLIIPTSHNHATISNLGGALY
jgi:hypothetical protein